MIVSNKYPEIYERYKDKEIHLEKNFYIMKSLTEEDLFYSMKIVHWQNWNLLVLGYNRKVKILHFYYIYVDYGFKPLIISKLEGNIDIIEHKNQYILFCSKENKIIYCFRFMNNKILTYFISDYLNSF